MILNNPIRKRECSTERKTNTHTQKKKKRTDKGNTFSKTGLCTGAQTVEKVSERERNVEHFRRWKRVAKIDLSLYSHGASSRLENTKHKLVITTDLHWFYKRNKKKIHGQLSATFSAFTDIRLRVEIFGPCSIFSMISGFLSPVSNFLALLSCFSFSFYTISIHPSFSFTENRGSREECLFFF